MTEYRKVEGSTEAAIGGGILSVILARSGGARVLAVECDPNQTGDEVEMFVTMRGIPSPVVLRLAVTEVFR